VAFQKFPNIPTIFIVLKKWKGCAQPCLQYSQSSECTDRTMELVCATVWSAYPQCAAGKQSISELHAARVCMWSEQWAHLYFSDV